MIAKTRSIARTLKQRRRETERFPSMRYCYWARPGDMGTRHQFRSWRRDDRFSDTRHEATYLALGRRLGHEED